MLKSVLTPKNIVFAVIVIAITGVAAYLILLSTGFKFPTQESKQEEKKETTPEKQYDTVKVPGVEIYQIVGTIKDSDKKAGTIVLNNILDDKEYRLQISDQPIRYKNNQTASFEDMLKGIDIQIGVYSKKKFDGNNLNKDFDYIVILKTSLTSDKETKNENVPSVGAE